MAQNNAGSSDAEGSPAGAKAGASSDMICVYTKDRLGRYTMANAATCLAMGRPLVEVIGRDDRALLPEAAALRIAADDATVIEKGEIVTIEESLSVIGEPRLYRTVKSPIRNEAGDIIGLSGVSWDITGSRASEIANQDDSARIRDILDNLFAFVALLDTEGVILEVNRAPLEQGGLVREKIIGQLFYETPWWSFDPEVRTQLISAIAAAAQGQRIRYDVINRMRDGVVVIDFQLSPLFSKDGRVRSLLATAVDVTKRKEAEDALLHQMEILAQAQSVARIGSWTLDYTTGEATASGELNRLIGLDPGAGLTPEQYQALNHPDDRPMVAAAWQAILRGETNEITYRNIIDGQIRWMNSRVKISVDAAGKPKFAIGTLQDITEQKKAELRLQEYQEGLEGVVRTRTEELNRANRQLSEIVFALESVGTAIFWNDAETGKFTAVNQYAAEMLGYEAEELVGMAVPDIDPNFSLDAYRQVLPILRDEGFLRFETTQRRKDGAIIPVEMTIYRQPPIPGQPDRLLSFGVKIAERKAAEQALLEAKSQAESANLAKSTFLATISHEIRTPMNAIIGMALLAMKTELTSQQRDYLKKIMGSSELLLGIINDILDFSKIDAGKMTLESKEFDLEALIEKIVPQLEANAGAKRLELLVDISPEAPRRLVGDELRLGQILLNLGSNAVKFTEQGEVSLHVRPVVTNAHDAMIRFEVSDSGIGLTAPQIEGLFQSFHQADSSITRKYGGSGLGLAICKNLVEMMGGEIGVESTPGTGSSFWFTVNVGVGKGRPRAFQGPSLRGARALVIDDHPKARDLLERLLQEMGLEVICVGDGHSGLEQMLLADERGEKFEFAFIDHIMPEMTGPEAARLILHQALASPPKCILVTGQTSAKVSRLAQEAGFAQVLHKPVSASQLFETLERCMGLGDRESTRAFSADFLADAKEVAGAHALLVEDNELNQEVALAFLQEAGLSVDLAVNGRQALEMVRRSRYDIVLMDVQMPVMDGLSATREIRRLPGCADLPIVAMTANAMDSDRARCLEAGMNDHIGKPIDPKLLVEKLLQWIKKDGLGLRERPQMAIEANDGAGGADLEGVRTIAGLDVDRGLGRCLGRESLYLALLRKFVSGQEEATRQIRDALRSGQRGTAEQLAHTLKGVSAQIGAEDVAARAADLEQAIRGKEKEAAILAMIESLDLPLSSLICGLEKHLQAVEREPSVASFDPEGWRRVRDQLVILLRDDDVASIDIFETNRDIVKGGLGSAYESFARALEVFDFGSASEILENGG